MRRAVGASLPDCGLSTRILFCVFYIPVLYCVEYNCVEYNPPYINVTPTNAPPVVDAIDYETCRWRVSTRLWFIYPILFCARLPQNVTNGTSSPSQPSGVATVFQIMFHNKILRIIYYNDVRCRYITY